MAEAYVGKLLDRIIEILYERTNPVSVYLVGSFGRGEGTIGMRDGRPQLWRDIDLVLLYRTRESGKVLQEVRRACMALPGVVPGDTTITGADISLAQLPAPLATRWRDLKMLELATRARHLAGRDVRERMAVRDGQIPLESGQRFLHQKATGLCLLYPRITAEAQATNYEVTKLYIELTSALSVLEGRPSVDFWERIETLGRSDDPRVRRMAKVARDRGAYKVEGRTRELSALDPTDSWRQGRDDLVEGLTVLHEAIWGEPPDLHTPVGLRRYYERLASRFIPQTLGSTLSRRWPIPRRALISAKAARLAYGLLAWSTLGADRRTIVGCPLSALYTGSLALAANLEPGDDPAPAVQLAQPFFELTGRPLPAPEGSTWTTHVQKVFYHLAKPLYGVN